MADAVRSVLAEKTRAFSIQKFTIQLEKAHPGLLFLLHKVYYLSVYCHLNFTG